MKALMFAVFLSISVAAMMSFSSCIGFLVQRSQEPGVIAGQIPSQRNLKRQFRIEQAHGVSNEDIREAILRDVPIGSTQKRVRQYIDEHSANTGNSTVVGRKNWILWRFESAGKRSVTFEFENRRLAKVDPYKLIALP